MNNEITLVDLNELDDIEVNDVTYEVWAIGYDNDQLTNTEMFINEFKDPDDAVEYAKNLDISDVIHRSDFNESTPEGEINRISLEVETSVLDEEDSWVHVGTVYKRDLWIDGEYGSEENIDESEIIVNLDKGDYEVLGDGTLVVKCERMENFAANDLVNIKFIEEPNSSICTFSVISKVKFNRGEYFHCDFEFEN